MAIDFYQRKAFITDDGSCSLQLTGIDEQYHSVHGAANESMHIYIQAGLNHCTSSSVNIFEAGFGTGLNAALTMMNQGQRTICYDTVEAYPLSMSEVGTLNYDDVLVDFPIAAFQRMHAAADGEVLTFNHAFSFKKHIKKMEELPLSDNYYDIVYFDMFNPDLQPELWTEAIFSKIYAAMKPCAFLVTYCAKGKVKRALKTVGFQLESLPGPTGKREITRAVK